MLTQEQKWEKYLLDLDIHRAKVAKYIWKLKNNAGEEDGPSTQDGGENPTGPLPPKPPTP